MFKNDLFISSSVFLGIFRAACNNNKKKKIKKKLKCRFPLSQSNSCGILPEDHPWKALWDLPHHVAVEGRRVRVHHEQKLVHGLMKWGNQPSHHTIQVLKLPLPICHLPHHGSQCCPLDHKRIIQHMFGAPGAPVETHLRTMAATAADTDPPPGAAVRAPTLLTNCCMDRDTRRLSSCGFTMYLHRFEYRSGQTWCKHLFCLKTRVEESLISLMLP